MSRCSQIVRARRIEARDTLLARLAKFNAAVDAAGGTQEYKFHDGQIRVERVSYKPDALEKIILKLEIQILGLDLLIDGCAVERMRSV
jgi:hypothetical protein